MSSLTPREIVLELDKYVIGQEAAKKAVAVALRNRYRRQRLDPGMRDEVMPRNILMIGPTGVGKTEIARRLAKLAQAPFLKIEASKFTEVGYVGRDVESMVRDLVEVAVQMVKAEAISGVQERAQAQAEERILDLLLPPPRKRRAPNPFGGFLGGEDEEEETSEPEPNQTRERLREQLRAGKLEGRMVEVQVEETPPSMAEALHGTGMEEMGINLQEMLGGLLPRKQKRRKVSVAQAREILITQEAQRLIDMDQVVSLALERAQESGIIFLDEIDKICGGGGGHGPDVSREGVQRDILPIIEGSTVMTKHGAVKTDQVLFIAAGAFHVAKPSDLIPELQGRFPIRVELESLGKEEFLRILVEPRNALVHQYTALLQTEGISLEFAPEAIEEIASLAQRVNEGTEDIGARRLVTIMEKLLEELAYEAPEVGSGQILVDGAYVRKRLEPLVRDRDLSRYIL